MVDYVQFLHWNHIRSYITNPVLSCILVLKAGSMMPVPVLTRYAFDKLLLGLYNYIFLHKFITLSLACCLVWMCAPLNLVHNLDQTQVYKPCETPLYLNGCHEEIALHNRIITGIIIWYFICLSNTNFAKKNLSNIFSLNCCT